MTTKNVMFVVTENCNFACRYCYLRHKNPKTMSWETAKSAVDFLLGHPDLFSEDRVQIDFIGGEPLLEICLIHDIIDYLIRRSYELGHKWFENMSYTMSSNGSLYAKKDVQRLRLACLRYEFHSP